MEYKKFQKDTIKKIVSGYESDKKNNRFLVADEVGLGKTLIAKGVIRCLLYFYYIEKIQSRDQPLEFKVLYLCSNLNIAEQNKRKLGVSENGKADFLGNCLSGVVDFKDYKAKYDENTGSSIENRTTMLLKQQINKNVESVLISDLRKECVGILGEDLVQTKEEKVGVSISNQNIQDQVFLNIIPITPNTSIKIRNGGHIEERKFISGVLKVVKEHLNKNKIDESNLVKDLVNNIVNGENEISLTGDETDNLMKYLDGFIGALNKLLGNDELELKKLLDKEYSGLAKKINITEDKWKKGWEQLRKLFALASMELLKYDFVVMDEFQNFNDILQKANQTQAVKQQYVNQVRYIYEILNTQNGEKYKGICDVIKKSFNDITKEGTKEELTEYEKKFWQTKLEAGNNIGQCDIESIIKNFFDMSRPDIKILMENEEKNKECNEIDMLQLVKAILNFDGKEENKNIIKKAYNNINNVNIDEKSLSKISYIQETSEGETERCEEDTAKCYGKNSLEYYIHKELFNMYLEQDCKFFESGYKEIRGRHPYSLQGVSLSATPFDYFIYLFLKNDDNSPNGELLLNCFQYFYKKNGQNEKSVQIWQYSYLLRELLSKDKNRFDYSTEQLEPFRKMLGLFQKRTTTISTDIDEQMILNHIFKNEIITDDITRILMLSATPFKMYDNNDEDDEKNANIIDVCDFLDQNTRNNVSQKLVDYKNALLNYSNSCVDFAKVKEKMENFQTAMNKIFTRMERYAVLREVNEEWFNNVLKANEEDAGMGELPCGKIKELKCYLEEINNMKVGKTFINYAIDAPYIGTFMHSLTNSKEDKKDDGYKWKIEWKKRYGEIDYKKDSKVYISHEIYRKNEEPLGLWHGVFNETLIKLLDLDQVKENKENHPGAARLLWVPSVVSTSLKGPFEEHKDYGKTILFSKYVQTPRMIACLTSYESRRRLCWKIKTDWDNKDNCDFKEYLCGFVNPENNEERSIYQNLKEVVKNIKDSILNKLIEKNSFLIGYFKKAIYGYLEKKYIDNSENGKVEALIIALTKAFCSKVLLNDEQGMLAIWASYGFPSIGECEDKSEECFMETFAKECCEKIKKYCNDGCLADVLAEWFYICAESNQDFGEFIGLKKGEFLSYIKESRITIDLYADDGSGKIKEYVNEENDKKSMNNATLFFARCIGMSKDDDNINAVKGLQQAFNSPFAPFVFATTSMGQEGLDFHYYADNIVHWKLPSNPVDFEQREGRINRYHCLAIRKKAIAWWDGQEKDGQEKDVYEIFENAFKNALTNSTDSLNGNFSDCGMIPDWILLSEDKKEQAQIRRIVPYFYLSKMAKDYNRNLKILQLYRTVIGQGNPEEIMERLMSSKSPEEIKHLFVDFSPYSGK